MYKKPNSLIIISFIAMMGLLALQAYWIVKIYKLTGANFVKEVNMAFEDGIKKELSLRCDTIQKIIENRILDTTVFVITSKFNQKEDQYVYTLSSKNNLKDKFSSFFFI